MLEPKIFTLGWICIQIRKYKVWPEFNVSIDGSSIDFRSSSEAHDKFVIGFLPEGHVINILSDIPT